MTALNAQAPVDVRKNLRMVLQHVVICGSDKTIEQAIHEVDDAFAVLIEAASVTLAEPWEIHRLRAALARVSGSES